MTNPSLPSEHAAALRSRAPEAGRLHAVLFPLLLFLSVFLAACTDAPDSDSVPVLEEGCEGFTVPPLPLGTEATYDVEGRFATVQQPWLNVAMALLDPDQDSILPIFPADSSIHVQVAEESGERLDQWGKQVPAIQVRYAATVPGTEDEVQFLDEWIETTTGTYIQDHQRTAVLIDDHVRQFIHLTRTARPGTLFSSILWDEALHTDYERTVVFPGERYGPTGGEGGDGSIQYAVRDVGLHDSTCTVHLHATVEWPQGPEGTVFDFEFPDFRVDLLMEEDSALPVWLNATWSPGDGVESFAMERTLYRPGSGQEHVPLPGDPGHKSLDVFPLDADDGVPVDRECRFGTCLHDAMNRIKTHPDAMQWLQQNPEAEIRYIEHRDGDPQSNYRDRWWIDWESGTERLNTFHFTLLHEEIPQLIVNIKESDHPVPPPVTKIIALDDMADLHESVHGTSPEVMTCFFDAKNRNCGVSTHLGAGKARVQSQTDWESPSYKARGVLFGFDGHVYQIDSYDPVLLGPGMT